MVLWLITSLKIHSPVASVSGRRFPGRFRHTRQRARTSKPLIWRASACGLHAHAHALVRRSAVSVCPIMFSPIERLRGKQVRIASFTPSCVCLRQPYLGLLVLNPLQGFLLRWPTERMNTHYRFSFDPFRVV